VEPGSSSFQFLKPARVLSSFMPFLLSFHSNSPFAKQNASQFDPTPPQHTRTSFTHTMLKTHTHTAHPDTSATTPDRVFDHCQPTKKRGDLPPQRPFLVENLPSHLMLRPPSGGRASFCGRSKCENSEVFFGAGGGRGGSVPPSPVWLWA